MIIKQKNNHLKLILIGFIVVLVVGSLGWLWYIKQSSTAVDRNEINYDSPTNEQVKAGNKAKEETVQENQSSQDPKLQDSNQSSSQDKAVTQLTTATVKGGMLYIRNNTSGIYSTGKCSLTLTKGSSVVTRSADVQPLPKSTTCKGFNIPLADLSKGTWSIDLTVTVGGQVSKANGKVEV